jgi:uncharacterized protein YndB with AHSA1/START domain
VLATSSIDLDSDPKVMVGTRLLDAPRELVWSVWTDPKHLAQWWGPDGFRTTTSAFDFQPGGVWRFVMHGPDGRDYENRITFDEIVKPERIAYHHGGGDDQELRHACVTDLEFLSQATKPRRLSCKFNRICSSMGAATKRWLFTRRRSARRSKG